MHKDDEKWVSENIIKIADVELRMKVWQSYKKAYEDAYNKEPKHHRKENKARFEANSRLRIFVNKNTGN